MSEIERLQYIEGGPVGAPLATLPFPVYDLAVDGAGHLWATTGGGPLLRLDAQTGAILGRFGDGLTQTLAVQAGTGLIYVSSGKGIEIFDPAAQTFRHFSDVRVNSLAFAPDGTLWAATWPNRGNVVRFDAKGKASVMVHLDTPADAIAFGVPGSRLEGLLFVSNNNGALTLIDVVTLRRVTAASGGSRGANVRATADGRVFLSQSHEIDVLNLIAPPHVADTNPPDGAIAALPLDAVSVTFDQAMYVGQATESGSVLNPANYLLRGETVGDVPVRAVAYDAATHTALLRFDGLEADHYRLAVHDTLAGRDGLPLPVEYTTQFTAVTDLSSLLDVRFTRARSDRDHHTISYDVTVTSKSAFDLLLPVVLQLSPLHQYDGEPVGAAGRSADGSWLIDLSQGLPGGILHPGQSTTGQTVTVYNPTGQRVAFDPTVSGLPTPNGAPSFTSQPLTGAAAAQAYAYQAAAQDSDHEALTYILYQAPAGMTVDAATGLVSWAPTTASPAQADVALQVYDSRGAHATQTFTVAVAGANRAPVLAALAGTIQGKEGQPLRIPIAATDPDGDALVFWADHLPGGAVFDTAQHALLWTPDDHAAGTYADVRFVVSDGLHQVSQATTLLIAPAALAPTLRRPSDRTVREGDPVRIDLQAADPDGKPLTFSSTQLPPGASLDPNTGAFRWTPTFFQHGTFVIPFTVSNGVKSTPQKTTITVLNVNAAPVFDNLDGFQVQEGQQLTFQAFAFDPDNPSYTPPTRNADGSLTPLEGSPPSVTYTVSGLPAGATFDADTTEFAWTPGFNAAGTYAVTFTATDDGDGTGTPRSSSQTVLLTVGNVNRPPQLTPIVNQTVARGTVLDVAVQATDPDGEPLVLTAGGLPGFPIPHFATFTDNGDGTGLLHFVPGAGDRGDFPITLRARDHGDGDRSAVLDADTTFLLTVNAPNDAPRLVYTGDKVAVLGETLQFTLRATDADQDALTFSVTGLPAGATLTPGPAYGTAVFSWAPTAADAGTRSVTFRVTDAGSLSDALTLRVSARATDSTPVLAAVPAQTVTVGQTLALTLSAADADGDALTYTASNLPAGAALDPATGVLTWTPQDGQAGTYPGIVLAASDGSRSATQTVTFTVTAGNHAPVFTVPALQLGREGAPVKFTLVANDRDNDQLTFSVLAGLPAGAQFDTHTGTLTWTPGFVQAGDTTVRFHVADPSGLGDTADVTLRIANVNRPPVLQASDHAVVLGMPLQFQLAASDPDLGTSLTFTGADLPAGATLDIGTGGFAWTPGPGQAGEYVVTFSVSDGAASASRTVLLRALLAAQAPQVTVELTPSAPAVPGQPVLVHAAASSLAGITALSVTVGGQVLALDGQGRATYTPTGPGRIAVEATATDADGFTGHASAVLKVRDPNDQAAPVVALDPHLVAATLTAARDVTGTVSDSNLDSWVLERATFDSDAFLTVATGDAPVAGGTLAHLDPGALANGFYRLRLTATDISGRSTSTEAVIEVNTAAKPAQYRRRETDRSVSLGGATVDLVREYDSLAADTAGTFGFGWRLANRDTAIQTNVPATGREALGVFNPFRVGTRVYLTLPEGERVGFTFAPVQHQTGSVTYYTPAFQVDLGVAYTLTSADAMLTLVGNRLYDLSSGRAYHPASPLFHGAEYTLTAPDGTVYHLSGARGVEEEILPNGNRLTFSDSGIVSSTGETLTFVHDAAGRLTQVTAADGNRVIYTYDAAGNLTAVREPALGRSSRYGYDADNPHLLDLIVASDNAASAVIRHISTPQALPLAGDLGGPGQFAGVNHSGNLMAGGTDRYAFSLRPEELHSTATGTVYLGISVQATGTGLTPALPRLAGHTPLASRTSNSSAFALYAVNRAGLELLEIAGADAVTAGAYGLHLFIAGDVNEDGNVDGVDGGLLMQLLSQHGYNIAADANGDGTLDATDVQLLGRNFGFTANRPPQLNAGQALTHTAVPVTINLANLAHDPDGDPVYFHVVGSQHGQIALNLDATTVTFGPDAGYSGPAGFEFQADDGYGTSAPAAFVINVSNALLVRLDFQQRVLQLDPGQAGTIVPVGDFTDQLSVVLPGSYVTFVSTALGVASVAPDGRVNALARGNTAVVIARDNLQAATVVRVGEQSTLNNVVLSTIGLNVFPQALSLATGDYRQLHVNLVDTVNLDAGSTGTRYLVGNSSILTAGADGLVTAQSVGDTTVTIINGPAEMTIPVKVEAPHAGPSILGPQGGVVQGSDGSIIELPPGALNGNATVSIMPVAEANLPLPVPTAQGFSFAAGFQLDVGPDRLNQPVRVEVPVSGIDVGTPVWFFRAGQFPDEQGHPRLYWEVVEKGVVGADGLARTTTPPYPGVMRSGYYVVVEATLKIVMIETRALAVINALMFSGLLVAEAAIDAFLTMPLLPGGNTLRFVLPESDHFQTKYLNVDLAPERTTTIKVTFPPEPPTAQPANPAAEPYITSVELVLATAGQLVTPELVVKGDRFDRNNPPGAPALGPDDKVQVIFATPDGTYRFLDPTPASTPGELHVLVPYDVAVGTGKILVVRPQYVNTSTNPNKAKWVKKDIFSNTTQLDVSGHYVFASLAYKEAVAVINGDEHSPYFNHLVARIPVGVDGVFNGPRAIAVTPDNTRAYVPLLNSHRVAVVDALALQEIDVDPTTPNVVDQIVLPDGAQPFAIAIDARGNYAYVTDRGPYGVGTIYVIDINPASPSYHKFQTITVNNAPAGLRQVALDADNKRLYVTAPSFGIVADDARVLPGHILVVNIDADTDGPQLKSYRQQVGDITVDRLPRGITASSDPHVLTFTNSRGVMGLGVIRANDDRTTWDVTYTPLTLGRQDSAFGVRNARSIAVLPDLRICASITWHSCWTGQTRTSVTRASCLDSVHGIA